MPKTLYDYYSQKGQSLPSLSERAQTYQEAGLGDAGAYTGSADQNSALLGHLSGAAAVQSAVPSSTDIGIGTLTKIPKTPIATAGSVSAPATDQNMAGLYERTGVTPPPAISAAAPSATPTIAGLPAYPSAPKTPQQSIVDSYQTLLTSISSIEAKLSSASMPTADEQRLQKELADKKAALGAFDVQSLQMAEDLTGQGRGATTGNIEVQQSKLARTRALERLGLAQEADTLTTQLGMAQDARKAQGDFAQTQYSIASKKLDIALGVQKEIDRINSDEQDNARQYLLDVVNFSAGKTYNQLGKETQSAITHAVANSPITLDMVKTALATSAEKAKASADGRLYSVSGLGVVMVNANGSGYKVVVPENPTGSSGGNANVPTFEDYVAKQNLPIVMMTQYTLDKLRGEYDSKYGSASVSLGKLTTTDKNDLAQAGLSGKPASMQSYFLNAPAEFRGQYNQNVASGKAKQAQGLSDLVDAYTTWYNAKQTSTRDWSKLLAPAQ